MRRQRTSKQVSTSPEMSMSVLAPGRLLLPGGHVRHRYIYNESALHHLGGTMVSFKCKDIGIDCPFEAKADNVHDLENKIAEHARTAHGKEHLSQEEWIQIKKQMK